MQTYEILSYNKQRHHFPYLFQTRAVYNRDGQLILGRKWSQAEEAPEDNFEIKELEIAINKQ
jgi:hypothetical protein